MKIALAQLNYHIGNFESNYQKIKSYTLKSIDAGAELIIFSELAVCGYPPLDLLEQKDFVESCQEILKKIEVLSNQIGIIIGAPVLNENKLGKKLYNSAIYMNEGKTISIHKKTLLPTYDVFDEYRYFEPNKDFEIAMIGNRKVAITICEDLWDNQPVENSFAREKLYTVSPMEELIKKQPDFIINIAASPFSYRQEGVRKKVYAENAKKYNLPVIYVNQVGAQTELVFDGGSMILNKEGELVKRLSFFEEELYITSFKELNKPATKENIEVSDPVEKIHDALILGVRDYFSKMDFQKATLGLSGGIDSAVTLVLAERALGSKNIRVLLLPSKYSSDHSVNDAIKLAENLDIQYDIISIEDTVDAAESSLKGIFKGLNEDITEENIQARIRGFLLMALSNKFGHILLNTSNKSEAAVGYGTLYGDMNGGLSVLGDVYKTEVYKLAEFINKESEIIPLNIITKPPSAELKPDQTDQDSLPEYEILDQILYDFIELKLSRNEIISKGFSPELVEKVIRMVNNSEYKRFQTPPIIRVSSKAFGIGRRIPLVARYK